MDNQNIEEESSFCSAKSLLIVKNLIFVIKFSQTGIILPVKGNLYCSLSCRAKFSSITDMTMLLKKARPLQLDYGNNKKKNGN